MKISVKHGPLGKPQIYPSSLTYKWINVEFQISTVIQHISDGKPLVVAQLLNNGHRKSENFKVANTIWIDVDKGQNPEGLTKLELLQILTDPFIQKHAFVVMPTASSKDNQWRLRIGFLLDQDITNGKTYTTIVKNLMAQLSLTPDRACSDPTRLFYGSKPGTEPLHVNEDPEPLAAEELMIQAITQQMQLKASTEPLPIKISLLLPPTKKPNHQKDRIRHLAKSIHQQKKEHSITKVVEKEDLDKKKKISRIIELLKYIPDDKMHLSYQEWLSILMALHYELGKELAFIVACNWTSDEKQGLMKKLSSFDEYQGEGRFTIATIYFHAMRFGYKHPADQKIEERIPFEKLINPNFKLASFHADVVIDSMYFDKALPVGYDAYLIKSPTGSGKTEYIKKMIKGEITVNRTVKKPKIIVIVHRRGLAKQLAKRLGIPCYLDIRDLANYDGSLVICQNSLYRLNLNNMYDLVFIDELMPNLEQFSSDLYEGNTGINTYKIFKYIIEKAKVVYAMDADMNDIGIAFMRQMKSNVLAVQNVGIRPKKKMTLHRFYHTVERLALEKAIEGKRIAIATTLKKSKLLYQLMCEHIGKEKILLVNSETADSHRVKDFIEDPNNKMPQVLIYTSSMGIGVDIQTPVDAVFGVIMGEPYSATDVRQMVDRCRNKEELHLYIQQMQYSRPTEWREIYNRVNDKALATGQEITLSRDGYEPSLDQKSLNRLQAMLEGERNRSLNDIRSHAYVLFLNEGYTHIELNEDRDEEMLEVMRLANQRMREEEKRKLLESKPVSHEEFQKIQRDPRRTMTEEIRLGYERWKIEKEIAQPLTGETYDEISQKVGKLSRLETFRLVNMSRERLRYWDYREEETEIPLAKRNHYNQRVQILQSFLQAVFHVESLTDLAETIEYPISELERRFTAWYEDKADIFTVFHWRWDISKDAKWMIRRLLKELGLTLSYRRIRYINEKGTSQRIYVYKVNPESVERMVRYTEDKYVQQMHQDRVGNQLESGELAHIFGEPPQVGNTLLNRDIVEAQGKTQIAQEWKEHQSGIWGLNEKLSQGGYILKPSSKVGTADPPEQPYSTRWFTWDVVLTPERVPQLRDYLSKWRYRLLDREAPDLTRMKTA